MAASARGLLLRLARPLNHQRHYQKILGTISPSPSPCHRYSSSSAEIDHGKRRKPSKSASKLDSAKFESRTTTTSQTIDDLAAHVDAPVDPDALLLKSLKKELKKASNSVQKYQIEIKGSFDPFELVSTEGTSNLTLRRQIGDEEIIVKCILQLEEPEDYEYLLEDNEDELNILQHLSMNIQINKASLGDETRFQLMCHYLSHDIVIQEVVYLGKSAYVENDYPYSGPLFSDLSERMQQAFHDIIKDRGIDASLADLIMDHLSCKYQEEYLRWVQNIRAFLKRKD